MVPEAYADLRMRRKWTSGIEGYTFLDVTKGKRMNWLMCKCGYEGVP